jgi:hypothetical protein
MKLLSFIIAIFIVNSLLGQWVQSSMLEYLEITNKSELMKKRNASFSFECDYLFFESIDGTKEKLKYNSIFQKNEKNEIYFLQFGKITVQNQKNKIILDSTENTIILTDADSIFQESNLFNITNYKSGTDKIKKYQDSKFVKFYFELPLGYKYKAYEIWFDLNNTIQKLIFYASQEINSGENDDKLIRPRMEINYKNYKFNQVITLKMKPEDILVFENEKITVNEKFAAFELIDLRKKTLEE